MTRDELFASIVAARPGRDDVVYVERRGDAYDWRMVGDADLPPAPTPAPEAEMSFSAAWPIDLSARLPTTARSTSSRTGVAEFDLPGTHRQEVPRSPSGAPAMIGAPDSARLARASPPPPLTRRCSATSQVLRGCLTSDARTSQACRLSVPRAVHTVISGVDEHRTSRFSRMKTPHMPWFPDRAGSAGDSRIPPPTMLPST